MAELGNISERRVAQLIMGLRGLPEFLVANPGLNSGFMIPQYAAASMVSQNKMYCFAASSDSIVSSNGQEDHVSIGSQRRHQAAPHHGQPGPHLCHRTDERRPGHRVPSPAQVVAIIEGFLHEYRKEVPFVKEDIVMYKEINKTVEFLNRAKLDNL